MFYKVLCVFENKAGSAHSIFTLVTGKTKKCLFYIHPNILWYKVLNKSTNHAYAKKELGYW